MVRRLALQRPRGLAERTQLILPRAGVSSDAAGIGLPTGTAGPPAVAVVVPAGGGAPAWERCARSLARLDPAPRDIIVVVDGPDDRVAAGAADIGATVIGLREPNGPAVARNLGARAADADILLFIDADIEVPADLVARVAGLFAERPAMTAVIGSYDDAPGDPGFLSQYRNLLHHYVHQHGREDASTFWAGCGAVRTRRLPRGRRLRRALRGAEHRGHRARRAPAAGGIRHSSRARPAGEAPEAVEARRHARHGPVAPRGAVDRADARRRSPGQRPQREGARPAQRARGRRRRARGRGGLLLAAARGSRGGRAGARRGR